MALSEDWNAAHDRRGGRLIEYASGGVPDSTSLHVTRAATGKPGRARDADSDDAARVFQA